MGSWPILETGKFLTAPIRSPFHLFPRQAKKMFLQRSEFGGWLFSNAIETGRVEMFKAVQATVYDKLTEEEVRRCTVGEGAW